MAVEWRDKNPGSSGQRGEKVRIGEGMRRLLIAGSLDKFQWISGSGMWPGWRRKSKSQPKSACPICSENITP